MLGIETVETHIVENQGNRVYFAEGTPAPKVRYCRCKVVALNPQYELKEDNSCS
jgi:hypothetical protein